MINVISSQTRLRKHLLKKMSNSLRLGNSDLIVIFLIMPLLVSKNGR